MNMITTRVVKCRFTVRSDNEWYQKVNHLSQQLLQFRFLLFLVDQLGREVRRKLGSKSSCRWTSLRAFFSHIFKHSSMRKLRTGSHTFLLHCLKFSVEVFCRSFLLVLLSERLIRVLSVTRKCGSYSLGLLITRITVFSLHCWFRMQLETYRD